MYSTAAIYFAREVGEYGDKSDPETAIDELWTEVHLFLGLATIHEQFLPLGNTGSGTRAVSGQLDMLAGTY